MSAPAHRHLFGWRLRSEVPLPELLPWDGDAREPDVEVSLGSAPGLGAGATAFGPAFQIAGDRVRLSVPGVATYLVEGGGRVVVDPQVDPGAPDIRVFLLGSVLSVLCYKRGLLPLHASAVEVGGRALLLAGESGLGKSTLAAALVARGHRLLSDDVCALDPAAPGGPLLWPSFPRLKLWEDAARQLSVGTGGLERSRVQLHKYHLPVGPGRFRAEPLPPAHVVLLRRVALPRDAGPRPLGPLDGCVRYDMVHRWRLGLALGCRALLFAGMTRLLRAAGATDMARVDDLDGLPRLAGQVLRLAGAGDA